MSDCFIGSNKDFQQLRGTFCGWNKNDGKEMDGHVFSSVTSEMMMMTWFSWTSENPCLRNRRLHSLVSSNCVEASVRSLQCAELVAFSPVDL